MKLIVITSPESINNEIEKISSLFEEGLEVLHVRKPTMKTSAFEDYLKSIPFKYYKKVVIHGHFKLCEKYNIKGIHLSGEHKKSLSDQEIRGLIKTAQNRNLTVSTSFHSIEEVLNNSLNFNYSFLSPVFDSISKSGYKSGFNLVELLKFMNSYHGKTKLIALGGLNKNSIKEISRCNFYGAAVLGAIWNTSEEAVLNYKELNTLLNQ